MKSVFKIGTVLVCLGFFNVGTSHAASPLGDEHPFPFSCFNFSGNWVSELGDEYQIDQNECKRLDITRVYKGIHDVQRTTIVPDDRSRKINGEKWRGEVRHRWDAKQYGSTVETYRVMRFNDREISEVVLLESVNNALILETVYRTTRLLGDHSQEPETENYQRIFRRAKPADSKGRHKGPVKH